MYVLNTYNFRYDMLHIICNIEIYRPEQGFTHQSQLAEDDKIQSLDSKRWTAKITKPEIHKPSWAECVDPG